MTRKIEDENLEESLQERFDRWDDIYQNGANDPFWEDGVNLMLVRNHILYYKGEMEKQIGNGTYPSIYHRATPPEIDRFYMARADEIRNHATRTLAAIKENPDIAYIRKKMYSVDKDYFGKTAASHILTYQQRLSDAIEKGELLEMRRFEKTDRVMTEIKECADKLREYVPPENTQLNVFDMLDDEDDIDLRM